FLPLVHRGHDADGWRRGSLNLTGRRVLQAPAGAACREEECERDREDGVGHVSPLEISAHQSATAEASVTTFVVSLPGVLFHAAFHILHALSVIVVTLI